MEYVLNPKQEELVRKLKLQECLEKVIEGDEKALEELVNRVSTIGISGFYILRATADVLATKNKEIKEILYTLTRERYEKVFSFVAPIYECIHSKENFSLIKPKYNLNRYSGIICNEFFGIA